MKRLKFYSSLILLLASGFFFQVSVFAEICNRVVAIVNNEMITLHELNAKIKELTGLDPADLRKRDEKIYFETRQKILDLLIDKKIADEKIRELRIEVAEKEVDAAIERIKKENYLTHEDLLMSLAKQGISYELYRESIKNEFERTQLIHIEVKSKIIITEERIKEYYDEHRDDFECEEGVHLAAIFLSREDASSQDETSAFCRKAEEILLRLKNGEDFAELAKRFSRGAGADEGGALGFFKTAQLDPQLKEIVENMSPGDVSEPVIRPNTIQIIKLVEKQEKRLKPVDEVRDAIYSALYREEVNKRYSSWIKGLREKAYTKIVF